MFLPQIKSLKNGDMIYHILNPSRIDKVKEVKIYEYMIIVKTEKGRNLFYGGNTNDVNIDLDYWDFYIPMPELDFGRTNAKSNNNG